MTLLELAAKVEGLSGPCREMDAAVDMAVNPDHRVMGDHIIDRMGFGKPLPQYTASLDAAMTLVPEGMTRLVRDASPRAMTNKTQCYAHVGNQHGEAHADAMPLALTAAALRARASISCASSSVRCTDTQTSGED